jgi:hypothetical protein
MSKIQLQTRPRRAMAAIGLACGAIVGGFAISNAALTPATGDGDSVYSSQLSALAGGVDAVDVVANDGLTITLTAPSDGNGACIVVKYDDGVYDGCIDEQLLASGTSYMSVQNRPGEPWLTVGVVPDDVGSVSLEVNGKLLPTSNVWYVETEERPSTFTVSSLDGEAATTVTMSVDAVPPK